MISTYNNYENSFVQLANLEVSNLPEKIEFDGKVFTVKPEFHITILSVENAAKIIDKDNVEKLKLEIVGEFHEFVREFSLTKYELKDELRLVETRDNKTIVVMAKLEGIEQLFSTLSKKYGINLPIQPAHVTLYYLKDSFGIPINSYDELEKISIQIEKPKELEAALVYNSQ